MRLTVCRTRSAVPHGTVLFSTMMAPGFAWRAISCTAPSTAVMSVALPAPRPKVLVGVLTARKIMSASAMVVESHVKNRLGCRREYSERSVPTL